MSRYMDDQWERAMDLRFDECHDGDRPWPQQIARLRARRPIRIPILLQRNPPIVVMTTIKPAKGE